MIGLPRNHAECAVLRRGGHRGRFEQSGGCGDGAERLTQLMRHLSEKRALLFAL